MRKVKVGYQFDFRNPPGSGRSFDTLYREMFRQAEAAEALGFDSLWLTEHHFTDDGYLPSMMPMAAALAARTRRVTIGTYVLLVPFHHPVKLAEDAAVTDVISGGRLRLGLGLGYRAEEFAGFGCARNERLGRTVETIEIMRRAWTGERFSHKGKYFDLKDVRVLPVPTSPGGPELLWGAGAAKTIARAAKLGLGFACVGGKREIGIYRDALTAAGKDPDKFNIVNSRVVYIADSEEEAWRDAAPHLMYQAELYGRWLNDAYGDKTRVIIKPDETWLRTSAVLGPVETVMRKIEEIVDTTPMTEFIAVTQLPGLDPAKAWRSLNIFGEKILPRMKG